MNTEINNDELDDFNTDDTDYFETENDQNYLDDEDENNENDEGDEDDDSEYEEDFENSQDDEDEDDGGYDGYSIGYFTVNDDKEVVESDEPRLIKLMEEYEGGPDEYSIYDNMLDDINSDEYDDIDSEENEYDDTDSEMYNDPDFKNALYINSELNEFNDSFTTIKNPYFALNALRDFLFNFNLILPHFDLPSNYDEWVFDVSLENKSEFVKSRYICHIEILCGENDDSYSVNAGIYPK